MLPSSTTQAPLLRSTSGTLESYVRFSPIFGGVYNTPFLESLVGRNPTYPVVRCLLLLILTRLVSADSSCGRVHLCGLMCFMLRSVHTCVTTQTSLMQISTKSGRKEGQCVLQALIHACSTPRFIDIQNTDSRYLGI
jgi:hypothetical protein